MKKRFQNGGFVQTYHAIFLVDETTKAETQLTAWDKRKDKVLAQFRRGSFPRPAGKLMIMTKPFVTPPKLTEEKTAA